MTCVAGNNLATHCLGYVHRFLNDCSHWSVEQSFVLECSFVAGIFLFLANETLRQSHFIRWFDRWGNQLSATYQAKDTFRNSSVYWIGLHLRKYVPSFASLLIPHSERIPSYYVKALNLFRAFVQRVPNFMERENVTIKLIYHNMLSHAVFHQECWLYIQQLTLARPGNGYNVIL